MITSDLFNNKKFVAEAIGDLGSKRDQGKSIRRWRKSRGLDEQGVAEGKADPVGSWVVYDGGKVKRFKSHEGAKAYAEKNGGKVASSEYYADKIQKQGMAEDWQKANKRDKTDGMSQKAVNAYRRENPGSKLKTAVTTKPSKLKKGGKASKRRKSYCSRSRGQMKMHSISCAKTPDKAICKARRRWNC